MKQPSPHVHVLLAALHVAVRDGDITSASEHLAEIERRGEWPAVRFVLPLLFHRDVVRSGASAVNRLVLGTAPGDLPAFEAQLRMWTRSYAPEAAQWSRLAADAGDDLAAAVWAGTGLLGVLSFHANGHVRERATRRLAAERSGHELPFLILRSRDWVEQVRTPAIAAVRERLGREHVESWMRALPLIDRLPRGGNPPVEAPPTGVRGWPIVRRFMAPRVNSTQESDLAAETRAFLVSSEVRSALAAASQSDTRAVRHAAFDLLRSAPDVDGAWLRSRALVSPDTELRLWAAREVRALDESDEVRGLVETMRTDRLAMIREYALERIAAVPGAAARSKLREALFDRGASVRYAARFYLQKRGESEDFAALYRDAVGRRSGREQQIAVAGLGETSTTADVTLLVPMIDAGSSQLARVALLAIVNLDPGHGRVLAERLRLDPRPGVRRKAEGVLRRM